MLIGPATRRLVGRGFRCREHAPLASDGHADPLPAWEVIGEGVASRFEALRGPKAAELVGREDELFLLLRRWEQARAGAGRVVLVTGEPGIGKSRLVRAVQQRLEGEAPFQLRYFCSPHHRDSPLHPVIAQLEAGAAFTRDDTAEARFAKLRAVLARSDATEEATALFASLLSIPAGELYRLPEMSPQKFRERTLAALLGRLTGLVAREPGLVIFEDVHWIDPTTLELLARTVEQLASMRVLLLVTARPEFKPPWPDQAHVTTLVLNRLGDEESAALVRQTAGEVFLPSAALRQVVEHAEGVPLFVEELTKAVLESGALTGRDGAAPLSIPTGLHDLLLARLDRLGPAREVAQVGAAIGREFSCDLLALVAGMPDPQLRGALDRLTNAGLVFARGTPPRSSYMFKHVLVQDAAYSTLLRGRRQELHASIAKALEEQFPDTIETEPELLAQHYTAAAAPEQAIPYWVRAGKRALERLTSLEPIGHFERGLALARSLPEGPTRSRTILELLLLLGEARFRSRQLREALDTFKQAASLALEVGSPTDLARAALGAEYAESFTGVVQSESTPLLEAALNALQADTAERSRLLSRLGFIAARAGNFEQSEAQISEANAIAQKLDDARALFEVAIVNLHTSAARPLSAPEFADRHRLLVEAYRFAELLGAPDPLAYVIGLSIPSFLGMGDFDAFDSQLTRLKGLIEGNRILGSQTLYTTASINALRAILLGDFVDAERLAEQALQVATEIPQEVSMGVYGVQMFTIRREQGRLSEVAPLIRQFVTETPEGAAWRPGLALIASDLGFDEAATKIFDNIAIGRFELPLDAKRNISLCYLAEVCARLGDAERADELYKLLLPYSDVAVVVPIATVCCGANARFLGMLASVAGDWTAAEGHFYRALVMDQRLHAWPWLAHTKHEFALMLQARGRPADRHQVETLLAEAAASADRFGMGRLQKQIRSLRL